MVVPIEIRQLRKLGINVQARDARIVEQKPKSFAIRQPQNRGEKIIVESAVTDHRDAILGVAVPRKQSA